jgi:ABC-type lipoprotein release transport system permease subunit
LTWIGRQIIRDPCTAGRCGAVLLATLAAGLYPAWKVGRVAPVETIKLV